MTEGENKNSVPEVQWLADLVNYQDGSVVSREIIRKSTGTVTLFAFDHGQGLSEHGSFRRTCVYRGRRSRGYYLWKGLSFEPGRVRDPSSQ